MKSRTKPMLFSFSRHELVRVCNEKLVCAAQDLAEFTKHGVNASYIVNLAHKCEHLEQMLNQSYPIYQPTDLQALENELRQAIFQICETGRIIWQSNSSKYKNYVISYEKSAHEDSFPEPSVSAA